MLFRTKGFYRVGQRCPQALHRDREKRNDQQDQRRQQENEPREFYVKRIIHQPLMRTDVDQRNGYDGRDADQLRKISGEQYQYA